MTTQTATSSQDNSAQALSDDDAFSKGFDSASTGEHTFLETTESGAEAPAAESQQQTEAQPAAAKTDSTTEDTAARFARLEAELASTKQTNELLLGRVRQVEGRTGQLSGDFKAIRTKLDQPTQQQATAKAPVSKLETLRGEYPEIAAAIDEVRGPAKPAQEPEQPEVQVDPIVAERTNLVERVHPGWQETVKTPEFKAWITGAPTNYRMLAESDDPFDAINLISAYRQAKPSAAQVAAPAQEVQTTTHATARPKPRQAVQPGTRSTGGTSILSDDDAFTAGFNEARKG